MESFQGEVNGKCPEVIDDKVPWWLPGLGWVEDSSTSALLFPGG